MAEHFVTTAWGHELEAKLDSLEKQVKTMVDDRGVCSAQSFALYQQRMENIERHAATYDAVVRDLMSKQSTESATINQRITDVEQKLSRELDNQTEKLAAYFDQSVEKMAKDIKSDIKTLDARISTLEVWRWVILGGSAVVMFVIGGIIIKLLEIAMEKGVLAPLIQ